jgi:catechol 2,3-dioxygenase-like lactoylglutathione lyase family enzyme
MGPGSIDVRRAVVLYTEDPERLASFYRDTLGFPLEPLGAPAGEFHCELGEVSVSVRAIEAALNDGSCERERIGALVLSLAVADLDAYLTALRQEGVDAGPLLMADGARGARLRDPDGNELELVEADGAEEARTAGWLEVVSSPPADGGN